MSEMEERVARAIVERRHGVGASIHGENLADARAAIEAMREPTEAMKWAGWKADLAPGYAIFDHMSAPSRGDKQAWEDVMGPMKPGGYGARQYSDWHVNLLGVAYRAMIDAALAPLPPPPDNLAARLLHGMNIVIGGVAIVLLVFIALHFLIP